MGAPDLVRCRSRQTADGEKILIDLSPFPRIKLGHFPTPLEPMERLSKLLGGPRLWIKRDDCTGLSTGGNKTRKLEFLMADALEQGADVIVTAGATQSNHTRQTAAAAARLGIECHLLLWNMNHSSEVAYCRNGNRLLVGLHGTTVHDLSGEGATSEIAYLNAEVDRFTAQLRETGRRPYAIPVGASNVLGALGYVNCAIELVGQAKDLGLAIDTLVLKSGSAGTHAGLVAGLAVLNAGIRVLGIGGGKASAKLEETVFRIAGEAALMVGTAGAVQRSDVVATDPDPAGYGVLTCEVAEVIRLVARTEGILLDPVYTGRAMVGLIELIRAGRYSRDADVVFLHTGGTASLFGYADDFDRLAAQAQSA
jgi:L-cysteate sulfo-lyase